MDNAAFAIWRADIALLTVAQRSLAFFELASAEANDPIDPFDQEEDAETARPNAISGAPDAVAPSRASSTVAAAAESDLLSQVGRDRIANFGCPHCGGDSIGLWGRANGMPRYRCKECRKTFSPLTGTPLAGLHRKDRWMDSGASSYERRIHRQSGRALRDRSHDSLSVASSLSFGSQSRQTHFAVGHRRGRRDVHSGILQGRA
jgi:transposase-like protein